MRSTAVAIAAVLMLGAGVPAQLAGAAGVLTTGEAAPSLESSRSGGPAPGTAPSGVEDSLSGGPPVKPDERPGFGLGMGVAIKDDPYVDIDTEIQPFPIFRYVGRRFSALGPNLRYRLLGERPLSVSALMGPTFDGYDPDDSDFLEGMDKRKLTIEGGLQLDYRSRPLSVSVGARHDLLSRHEGYQLEAEVSTFRRFGPVAVIPSLAYTYWDENRSDYYFGVRAAEARPDRPEYELNGTSNWSAGLFASADVTRSIFLLLGAKYFIYDDDITDSPIVDDDSTWRIFAGAGYQFGQKKAKREARSEAAAAALADRLGDPETAAAP